MSRLEKFLKKSETFGFKKMISDRDYMRGFAPQSGGRLQKSAVNIIIAACAAGLLLQLISAGWFDAGAFERVFGLSLSALKSGKVWTLVSYAFLHEGLWHLCLNMLVLYFSGKIVELSLGRAKFFALYFCSVLGGALFWLLIEYLHGDRSFLMGASAGVVGVLAYFCCIQAERPVTFLLFFIIPLTMRPKTMLYIIIGMELFGFVFFEMAPNNDIPIAYSAHLGGIIAALLFSKVVNGSVFAGDYYESANSSGGFFKKIFSKRVKKPMSADDTVFNVSVSSSENLRFEVNRILDKINESGFGSLTDSEKETLKRARDRF